MRTYEIQVGNEEIGSAHVGTVTAETEEQAHAEVKRIHTPVNGEIHWHDNRRWYSTPYWLVEIECSAAVKAKGEQ